MLNKLQNTMKSRKLLRIAVSMLIAVLMSGYILPDYAVFAENEPEKQEEAGGLSASEQVEDDGENSKNEHKTVSAADQVEDTVNKDAAKDQNDEDKKELSAQDQVEDEADHEYEYAKSGDFNAEIKGYKVNADVPEGAFDDEVRLQIKEAVANTDDAVNEKEDVVELTEEQKKELSDRLILYANHLDISFIGKDGKQREPSKEVGIEMSIARELITDEKDFDTSGSGVLHLSEKKNGEIRSADVIIDSSKKNTKSVQYDKKNEEITVKFDADDFSVYTYSHDWYNISVKFYYVDKGNMNRVINADNPGFGRDYNNSIFWNMPGWDTTPGGNDVRAMKKVDYAAGTYTVTPYTVNKDVVYDIAVPFGFAHENTYAIRTSSRDSNMSQRISQAAYANVKQAMRATKDNPNVGNGEEHQYWAYVVNNQTIHTNNPANQIDFAAVYKRLSASELPIYAVAEGTRTPLASTLAGFINDSTFTNGYKVNDNNTATSSNKYNMTFTNGQFMAFNKNYTIVRETSESKYVFQSAYIARDDGTTEGQKIEIKGLRYDGAKNLWFYSEDGNMSNTSALKVLTGNDKVYLEFDENIKEANDHKLYFRNGDGARNANGDYPGLNGSDGKDYFNLDSADNYKIDFTNDKVTYNGQTKSLKETFGISTDKALYKGFIRNATSGNIDGERSNEIEYIERTNGQLKIKMKGKSLTTLYNKAVYAVFHKEPELEELNTINNNALGFHVHMFNFKNSPMTYARGDNSWSAEYRRGITRAGSSREGETEQGLYGSTTTGGSKYSERFPNIEKVFKWTNNGGAFLDPTDVKNLRGLFNPVSSNAHYVGEANHLFLSKIYDETGYMYYNSEENAAVLNPANNGLMNFSVYNAVMSPVQDGNGNFQYGPDSFFYHRGNFLPFNDIDTSKRYAKNLYDANGYTWDDPRRQSSGLASDDDFNSEKVAKNPAATVYGIKSGRVGTDGRTPDYFHGMYAYMNFLQPVDGIVKQLPNGTNLANPEPMVYEFTGDDDMMVYIDGVLVLDLGGVHDAQSGKIDFSTGKVTYSYNGSYTPSGTVNRAPIIDDKYETTIKAQFDAAGRGGVSWRGNTFADATYHTMQIFYMERGQGASNLKIKVNIPPVPEAFFTVEKKVTDVEGVTKDPNEEFTMKVEYQKADGNWAPINQLTGVEKVVENPDGTFSTQTMNVSKYYIEGASGNLIDIGEGGIIKLKDGQRACIPGVIKNNLKVRVRETSSSKHNLAEYYDVDYSLTSNGTLVESGNNTIAVEVPATRTMGVVVTNTPPQQEKKTSLKLRKEVGQNILRYTDTETAFRIWVEIDALKGDGKADRFEGVLTRANGDRENITVEFEAATNQQTGTIDGRAKFDLKHGESVEIKGLPVGAGYTVGENLAYSLLPNGNRADLSGDFTQTIQNQTGTLAENSVPEAVVKNTPVLDLDIQLVKKNRDKTLPLEGVSFTLNDLGVQNNDRTRFWTGDQGVINNDLKTDVQGKIQGLTAAIAGRSAGQGELINRIDGFENKLGFVLYENAPKAGYKHATAPWVIIVDKKTGAVELRQHSNHYASPVSTENSRKYWNVSDYGSAGSIVSDKILTNDLEPEHVLYKVDETTMPKDGNGNYTSVTDAQFAQIRRVAGATFRVIEATSQTPEDGHIVYSGLQVVQKDGKDLTVTSTGPDGEIRLPRDLNPSSGQTARYFLLEEIEAASGYAKASKPYAIAISWQGMMNAGNVSVRIVDAVYEVNTAVTLQDGQSWADAGELICTDIDQLPYQAIPNTPFDVNLKKVDSASTNNTLPNAVFRLYKTQWDDHDSNYSKAQLLSMNSWTGTNFDIKATQRVGESVEIKSDASGNISLPITEAGEYFLFEETAPAGYYRMKAPWIVIVKEDGTYTVWQNTNPDFVKKGSQGSGAADPDFQTLVNNLNNRWWPSANYEKQSDLKLRNDIKPVKLLKVKDDNTTVLKNAEFVVSDIRQHNSSYWKTQSSVDLIKDANDQVIKLTSNDNGVIDLSSVLEALTGNKGRTVDSSKITLMLFETTAPTGHVISRKPWMLTIDEDRNVTLKQYALENESFVGNWNAATGTGNTTGYIYNNAVMDSFLTSTKELHWAKNQFGTETADGKLQNTPQKIRKVDADDHTKGLANVEFEIWLAEWNNSGQTQLRRKTKINGTFKSDANGYIDISKLYEYVGLSTNQYMDTHTTFLIYETHNPNAGYIVPNAPWQLIIRNRDGKHEMYSGSGTYSDYTGWIADTDFGGTVCDGDQEIITNTKTSGKVIKVDGKTRHTLSGVTFRMFAASQPTTAKVVRNSTYRNVSSDASGIIDLGSLESKYYLLYEETPKAGYVKEVTPWLIEVSNKKVYRVYKIKDSAKSKYPAGSTEFLINDFTTVEKEGSNYAVENEKIYELPSAGGIGVYPFTIIGTMMVMIALVLLFARKENEEC